MSPERFDHLLGLIEPSIAKEDIHFCKTTSAEGRLAVTLLFLASGESKKNHNSYHLRKSTRSRIIREACDTIFEAIASEYFHPPS